MHAILIAVVGNNGIGKTTFAAAITAAIAKRAKGVPFNIFLVNGDTNVPALGCWRPNKLPEKYFSFGALMAQPDIYPETVAQSVSHVSGLDAIGLLGYREDSKNADYETPDEDKVNNMLVGMKHYLTDDFATGAVIVDCCEQRTDPFTAVALQTADIVFMLLHADMQGVMYYHANSRYIQQFKANETECIIIPVVRNTFDPVDIVETKYFHTDFPALPRIDEAHRKMVDGKLFAPYNNAAYNAVLDRAVSRILEVAEYEDSQL